VEGSGNHLVSHVMGKNRERVTVWTLGIVIPLLTFVVFGRMLSHAFLNCDDPVYVTSNSHVQNGLSINGLKWAFTTMTACFYHPVVWCSLMLDRTLFGVGPKGFLLTNLILHALSSLVLFTALNRMTNCTWRNAFVSAMFAIHPLHVESVAWVAERKDVLSGLFWMITIWMYVRYCHLKANRSSLTMLAYCGMNLSFILGLLSKPTLVTLPLVLFLLDWWPLARISAVKDVCARNTVRDKWESKRTLVFEKMPMFILSFAAGFLAVVAQGRGGALGRVPQFDAAKQFAVAVINYAVYLGKALYPIKLAPFYPVPEGNYSVWLVAVVTVLFVGMTVWAIRVSNSFPYLIVGWLWYLITLVPVSGVIRIGAQVSADRYMYIPLVGLLFIIAWGVPELVCNEKTASVARPSELGLLGVIAFLAVIAVSLVTFCQVEYWRDNESIYYRSLEVAPRNYLSWNNLGAALEARRDFGMAVRCYQKALEIEPEQARAHNNLGNIYVQEGRWNEAVREYRAAVRFLPNDPMLHSNLGVALAKKGRYVEAVREFRRALKLDPTLSGAYDNLVETLLFLDDYSGAREVLCEAKRHGVQPAEEIVHKFKQRVGEKKREGVRL